MTSASCDPVFSGLDYKELLRSWVWEHLLPANAVLKERDRPPRRRSRRISLFVPVEVSGKDVSRSTFKIATTATNLNRHGATVHLHRDLPVKSVIVVKNSRGTRTCARIVVQTRVRDIYAYGLEFLEPDKAKNFWGIRFPSYPQERRPS